MSALPLPARDVEWSTAPRLRLVEAPPRASLAPTGPIQAWRRRIGALLVLLALVAVAVDAMSSATVTEQPVTATVPVSDATVVVQPGQTLWDVAIDHAPDGVGTAVYVEQLAELNGVVGGQLDAWQVLRLPAA